MNYNELSDKIIVSNNIQNIDDTVKLAKEIFTRATKDSFLSQYFNSENVENSFAKLIVSKSKEEYKKYCLELFQKEFEGMSEEQISEIIDHFGGFSDANTGNIYIPPTATLEEIVHELVHHMSVKNNLTGIYQPVIELSRLYPRWKISADDAVSLDEAFTEMITRVLIPELEPENAYEYGSNIITQYYNLTSQYNKNPERFFEAYFNKDTNSLESLEADISNLNVSFAHEADLWFKMIKSARVIQDFYTTGKSAGLLSVLNKNQLAEIFIELENSYSYEKSF